MSRNTPNPVALTAAMLAASYFSQEFVGEMYTPHTVANLASAIHRLAPACKRLAESEANGTPSNLVSRLPKRIAALSAELAPFGYSLERDDANLYLVSGTERRFIY